MTTIKHARRGRGNAVHAIAPGGQLCGAGVTTIGTRKTYRLRYTDDPVTCKTCLKRLEKKVQS